MICPHLMIRHKQKFLHFDLVCMVWLSFLYSIIFYRWRSCLWCEIWHRDIPLCFWYNWHHHDYLWIPKICSKRHTGLGWNDFRCSKQFRFTMRGPTSKFWDDCIFQQFCNPEIDHSNDSFLDNSAYWPFDLEFIKPF